MTVSKAYQILAKALREDPGLYYGYQSNIAMAFYDEMNKKALMDQASLHEVANQAAKNFLDMWIR